MVTSSLLLMIWTLLTLISIIRATNLLEISQLLDSHYRLFFSFGFCFGFAFIDQLIVCINGLTTCILPEIEKLIILLCVTLLKLNEVSLKFCIFQNKVQGDL